jgi:hypothetical protein
MVVTYNEHLFYAIQNLFLQYEYCMNIVRVIDISQYFHIVLVIDNL